MPVRVTPIDLNVLNMRTRMPFKYGIATLTALPHLFVRLELDIDGERQWGVASDGLPPKWFTKVPEADPIDEIDGMLAVIRSACDHALAVGEATTVFDLWREVYERQSDQWSSDPSTPPLLFGLGVSLVERAVIDAACRASGNSLDQMMRAGQFGFDASAIHDELSGRGVNDLLPRSPRTVIVARHTVGLADPLTDGEIPPGERLEDGLPQSLEACIAAYGLTHLKIKLVGDPVNDIERLRAIARVAEPVGDRLRFTLDGNEQYRDVEPFAQVWNTLFQEPTLESFMRGLLFVEQPFQRDVALSDALGTALRAWGDRPSMIIDESDGTLDAARRALGLGYAGTSHKNCKGVFKGIANACLLELRRRQHADKTFILSGEDLANVGPVALLQDLNVAATLGIEHVERNGHHYFKGLSMYPDDVQSAVLKAHPDLYRRHEQGYATVRIEQGKMGIESVRNGPLGPAFDFDTTRFTPLDEWTANSLTSES